ncbi:hypothetical protein J421_2589 [Gemmatirosa kalamazoonensis]|jgi:hypothetical protein|uniref:Lipoprotein n=1 Tax=Gemmatirosa kalamazoonensis TaxID=861299 RepID=W0RH61_9BACT|nr:hypothetical protein [Gemmatirosa kalamazoonensis]AHG90126.1 hypothetical protein J421_2589 [Gemmatirosa kalamazoonensis]
MSRIRAAAALALTLTVLASTGCVRGRNDGGRDAAGESGNGAGPAPQPGPLAGQNTDTSMIAPAATNATATPPAGGQAATSQAAPAGAKRP